MTNKLWLRIAALVVACLVLAACGEGGSPLEDGEDLGDAGDTEDGGEAVAGDPVHFDHASFSPPTNPGSRAMVHWFELVQERAVTEVTFEMHWAGSLLPAAELAPGVMDGRADTGHMATVMHPAEFPLSEIVGVPFVTSNAEAAARAFNFLYEENDDFREEWQGNNLHLLGVAPLGPNMVLSPEPVTTLEDLRGERLRTCSYLTRAFDELGVHGVNITQPEVYEALERGVLDKTTCVPLDSATDFSYHEIAAHVINPGTGLYTQPTMVMNLDKWNSLPDDVRAAFEDTHDDYLNFYLDIVMDREIEACEAFVAEGGSITSIPQDEVDAWAETVSDELWEAWISEASSHGAPAEAFRDAYLSAIERFDGDDSIYTDVIERCTS